MQKRFTLLLCMVLWLIPNIYAQDGYRLEGTIFSAVDDSPIPGANIIKDGTTDGTITDIDGKFSLQVVNGDVLKISFLGFASQTITVNGQNNLTIKLEEENSVLDEVVVIGYGTQKKSHLTGAISKVKNEGLDQVATARVDDALVGQISGVNIQATNPEAGAAPTIRIRGIGSINANSDPLVVIDGIIVDFDFLTSIDAGDIESVEVLKDAASKAIYGARGANGVLIVTTKQGLEGKTRFTYNTYVGIKDVARNPDYNTSLADGLAKERAATGGLSARSRYKERIGIDNNWQDLIFDGGVIQSHALSVRGGAGKTRYSASLGYLDDEGVLLTDNFTRYNLRLKVDTKINDRFSFGANIAPSYSTQRRFGGSVHDILRQTPWLPIYHDENTIQFVDRATYPDVKVGDYAVQRHFDNFDLDGDGTLVDISNTSNTNPAAKVLERNNNDLKFKAFGSAYVKVNLLEGLDFTSTIGADYRQTRRTRWQGSLADRRGSSRSQSSLSTTEELHLTFNNLVTYEKVIGDHDISAVAGTTVETWDTFFSGVTGSGFDFDFVETINAATVITAGSTSRSQRRVLGFLGRVNYAYKDKYLVSLSFRRDGASEFGPDNKYGNFPAASLGWRVTEEPFMKNQNIFSELKVRASYGFSGNNTISPYQAEALLNSTTAIIDGSVTTAFNPANIANPTLGWERAVEFNPGIDFGILKNRITGSIEYYDKQSVDLLLDQDIPAVTGFGSTVVNLGKVQNQGIEFELRSKNIDTKKFKWSTTFLFSQNTNTLLDFAEADGLISNVDPKRAAEWINKVGNPISSFYGYVVDKEIPAEFIKDPYHPIGAQSQDVYVKDLNGDGVIDADDKTILGNPYPKQILSLQNNFKLGNFDLTFMIQSALGAQVRNMTNQYIYNHFNSSQDFIPETPNQEFIQERIFTNDIIQDASYVALRNVNLGYTLPKSLIEKFGLKKARFYVSGANLLYLTASDYTGFNPEAITTTSVRTFGYQRGGAPIARTVTFGANIEF